MRKKLLALVLALAMVVSLMVVPVSADTTTGTYGYLTYEIEDGAVTITDCDGSASGELVIPDTIEGYSVTSIGDYAFYYCYNLTEVSLPSGITSIGSYAFFCCFGLSELPLSSGITSIGVAAFSGTAYASNEDNWVDSVLYIGEYLIDYSGSGTCIVRDGTTLIAGGAFAWDDGALTKIVLPDSLLYIGERAFEDCAGLTEITIPASVRVIGESAFNYCIGLTAITLEGSDFTTGAFTFYGCRNVTTLTVNGTMDISWSFLDELTGLTTVVYNREQLQYGIADNSSNQVNYASSHTLSLDSVNYSTYSDNTGVNNGYKNTDKLQEAMDSEGNLFAFYGYRDSVLVVPEAESGAVLELENEGYTFGAATIGDDNYLYVVWGMTIYDDEIDDSLDVENVQIRKYDKNGSLIEVLGLPVQTTRAQFPFRSGNANIVYQAGYLCVLFDTRWMESSDGIQHQGCEFVGIDADTMTVVNSSTNQGSHSFGVSMIATDYGFAAVQMGDAGSGRGINLNRYVIEDGTIRTVSGNGRTVLFHSSGQYGTNANHLDGNDTYTYMAGVAMSNSTYAVAGKSERVYTTDIYYSSGLSTGIYDVFVRIADASLLLDVEFDLAGEDRIDVATGEVADQNVVWLTQCTETEQAGNVKIVTLDSGAYCVLWEKFVNGSFDSIRYVILDECGNILRQETAIYGARLSNTSIQPIVQGNTLSWAVADGFVGSITWYSVYLDALDSNHFTDVNTGHYFYNAVLWAVDNGITSGTTETTFSPFLTAERCQVVTFLWRAAGCPEPTSTENPFADVDEDDYFYNAVLWAVEKGITTGTSATTFSPFEKCERCQVVTFLYRYFGQPEVTTTSNPFTDVDTDDYFYNAVLWAVDNGITTGTSDTTFGPFVTCERCMVVTFLYRALVD